MSRVRTIQSASPEKPPFEVVESVDPILQIASSVPVRASDNRPQDKKGLVVDALGMSGHIPAGKVPQSRVSFSDRLSERIARDRVTNVANEPVTAGGRSKIQLQEAMALLAKGGFDTNAQNVFAKETLKDATVGDAAYMARALRESMTEDQLSNAKILSDAFKKHGLKLDPLAKIGEGNWASLDRRSFRTAVRQIIDNAKGELDKEGIKKIFGLVKHVSDLEDLEFARSQVDKRVAAGVLKLSSEADDLLHTTFDEHLDVKVGNSELALAAHRVRKAVENFDLTADDPLGHVKADTELKIAKAMFTSLVERALADKSSPDAVVYAHRVINRELNKGSCVGCSAAKSTLTELGNFDVGDRLDRKAYNAKIDARLARDEITPQQAAVLKVAVVTSFTNRDLRYTVDEFEMKLGIEVMARLIEIEGQIEQESRERKRAEERRDAEERAAEERDAERHTQNRIKEEHDKLRSQQKRVRIVRSTWHHDKDKRLAISSWALSAAASTENEAAAAPHSRRGALEGLADAQRGFAKILAPR